MSSYIDGWGGAAVRRCADSGNQRIHAHLINGNWLDRSDVAPSAVICVVSFLSLIGIGYRYRETRVHFLFLLAFALLFLGIAFAIRAALANTRIAGRTRSSTFTSESFFLLALTFFLAGHIIYARVFLNRASLVHWPSTLLYFAGALLLIALIVGLVALGQGPTPPDSLTPPIKYTQMRIASAALELIVAVLHPLLLPFAKLVAPELPMLELALLTVAGWFLFVPAFYVFCVSTITADYSPLVCSQTFFYLSFALFPFLALFVLLAFRLDRWGFTLPPRDLLASSYAQPATSHTAAAFAREDAALEDAAIWAAEERAREMEETEALHHERDIVADNAAHAALYDDGRHYDDGWSLRLH
ncbi:uncharacterized protein JCM10292_000249 [Rhodotorula paludigena]|uniref:uncharacterized protein n=1 Tax=Rhodotorula paludigena TaxID=86838 RepID=UPI003173D76D